MALPLVLGLAYAAVVGFSGKPVLKPHAYLAVLTVEEYALIRPYQGLPYAERLGELTDQYELAADEDQWGERLAAFLSRAIVAQGGRLG